MTSQPPFELPPELQTIYGQNLVTWSKLDELRPLLDLLEGSKDPATEEAREDLATVLASIKATTQAIFRQQTEMDAQLKEMGAILAALKPFLERMQRRLP